MTGTMTVQLESKKDLQFKLFQEAFSNMLKTDIKLKIITMEGSVSWLGLRLACISSPLINKMLGECKNSTSSTIFLPDVSKATVEHLLDILQTGYSDFDAMSLFEIQEVDETARMLQIYLSNLDCLEKSKENVPPCREAIKTEWSPNQKSLEVIEVDETARMLQIDRSNLDCLEKSKVYVPHFREAIKTELLPEQKRPEVNEKSLLIKTDKSEYCEDINSEWLPDQKRPEVKEQTRQIKTDKSEYYDFKAIQSEVLPDQKSCEEEGLERMEVKYNLRTKLKKTDMVTFNCKECDHQAETMKNLGIHQGNAHTKICDQCGQLAKTHKELWKHKLQKHKQICDQCGHIAKTYSHLKQHKRDVHGGTTQGTAAIGENVRGNNTL